MIPEEDAGLLSVARAIAAGHPVDWGAIEASGQVSASFAVVLRELKAVAAIADVHRSIDDASPALSGASDAFSSDRATTVATEEVRTWGSLTLLERVGRGAFGDVYRAWDPRLDREVALKLLRPASATSRATSVALSVVHEGRLLARVNHPNVVTVYGADHIDDRVGIWMEFVHGRTLETVLHSHGPFGAREATLIGIDVLRALSAVHRAGLVHRDLKAHNVMREEGGRIVLMDFGAGREVLAQGPVDMAGTPLYLAPELFGDAMATVRSDIYSVGVLLYHLVTGSYPLHGRSLIDLREGHAQRRRQWLRDARPDLPDPFVQGIERALAFDPQERYESAGAMELALRAVLGLEETAAGHAAPTTPFAVPSAPGVSTLPKWMALAAGLFVVSVIALFFAPDSWRDRLLNRNGPPAPPHLAAALTASSPARRVVSLPDYSAVGTPSADGRYFSLADISGNIAVVDLTTGQLHHVTRDAVFGAHSQYAELSVISPDSRFIAYAWLALDGKYELRVIDMEGRQPRVLLRSDTADLVVPLEWSRDGSSILAIVTGPNHSKQLSLISVDDGRMQTARDLGAILPRHASLSPDGASVVYDYPQDVASAARDIFIARSDGSEDRRLVAFPATDVNPVWTADGRHVLFVSDRSGTMDLWSVEMEKGFARGEPKVLQRNIGRIAPRGLTNAGSYYYHETVGAVDVYEAQLSPTGVQNARALPVTYSGSNISSLWSADGKRLAYASRRGPVRFDRAWTTIVTRDLETGQQSEITPAMNSFLLRSWSPDARSLLVQGADAEGRTGAHRIDIETGAVAPLLLNPPAQNHIRRPDWLRSGGVLYVNSGKHALVMRDGARGTDRLVWDLRAANVTIVGDVFGRGYRLSPDGETLAFTAVENRAGTSSRVLAVKSLDGAPTRELVRARGPELIMFQDWSGDGSALLFTRWNPETAEPVSLWRVSIHGGEPEPLGLAMEGLRDVSVHPDGSRITFTAGWPKAQIGVMENFLP